MFSTALSASQIDTYNASGTATAKSANPQAEQDKFMTMLVAQLNNQDPLNPMDNAQMTSQMAQINTVSGIQQLNKTMSDMATQFGSLQALQGVSLIGRWRSALGSCHGARRWWRATPQWWRRMWLTGDSSYP